MKEVFKRWRLVSTLFFFVILMAYFRLGQSLGPYAVIALVFIYYLFSMAFLFRVEYLILLDLLAQRLNFLRDLHIIRTPKLKGMYRKHMFKIEFWYKTTGRSSSFVRTYFKLYLTKKGSYRNLDEFLNNDNFPIIALRYNAQKNYLLMKVPGDITDFKDVKRHMDHLIAISQKAS